MNKYKWKIKEPLSQGVLDKFPEINPAVLQLLYDRGLTTQRQIDEFLNPDYSQDIHDPYLFTQMTKAVERIYSAKEKGEKAVIYGDYDADGVCGSAILHKTFQAIGLKFETYLPDREKDGYGLNLKAVKALADGGAKLIITVDCGISNKEETNLANGLGLEVIITDHHHVPEELPPALAVIHPRLDKKYPFDDLAGGGVAFKLAQAIIRDQRSEIKDQEAFEKWLLDLVAISTVADMVPLVGENRTLVKYGLIVLAKTKNLGLNQLMGISVIDNNKIDTHTIGFQIAPRINAAGRMDHANTAYELLTTDNLEEAITIAHQLNKRNIERQNLTEKLVEAAKKQLGEVDPDQPVLFAGGADWNPGIIGLVAGKLAQAYARPAIAFSQTDNKIVASGRSIAEFNLIDSLEKLADCFVKFGGHKGAAGFSILPEKFEDFKAKFTALAAKELRGVKFIPSLMIDQEISLAKSDWPLVEILEEFKPYGWGNYQPRFLIKDLEVQRAENVGADGSHLRMMVMHNNVKRKIICFGFGEICEQLRQGDKIDVVCEIGINEWNGNREIQLSLIDIKKAKG
jgi:single-stranded-DNA-specific exonuclease